MPAVGTCYPPIPQSPPPSPPADAPATITAARVSVRPADGLQGQLGLYEVTANGVTSYMSQQEVEALEPSLEPTSPVGSDPTQQGGSDASRSPGLLVEKDPGSNPPPAPVPLPGTQTTQSASGANAPQPAR